MNKIQLKVYLLMREYNGYITADIAKEYNINLRQLQRYAKSGFIERVAQGLYYHDEFPRDIYYETQFRLPKGIFSYLTSLYLHGLIDKDSDKISLTIPSGWNSNLIKERNLYDFSYIKEDLWEIGQETIIDENDHIITLYDKERTFVEILQEMGKYNYNMVMNLLRDNIEILDKDKMLYYGSLLSTEEFINRSIIKIINK